jgi:predicted O-methyltransferase YrrM
LSIPVYHALKKGGEYLSYLFKAGNRHQVHSPFVYAFTEKVLNDKKHYPEYDIVEDLVKQLKENTTFYQKSSPGAESQKKHSFRKVKEELKYSAVDRIFGRLLFRICNYYQPRTSLELGTSLGISAFYQSLGIKPAEENTFYSIEGCEQTYLKAVENKLQISKKVNLSHLQLLNGNFQEMIPSLLGKVDKLDLVYLDGDHRREAVHQNYSLIKSKLHSDSILIIDDIRWSEGMRKAWRELQELDEVSVSIDLFRMGILFFRRGIAKQHFILKF